MDRALPRSLTGWLVFLWSRVLFAGPCSAAAEPVRRQALAALVLLPGVLLYPCLGFHLFEPDESRYAQIPWEMLRAGEWVVPTLQGEPYLDKPPLFYWLVMASYRLLGVHDWSARLVPALAVHATILLTYLLGRRTLGERPAWWAALFLALAPGFLGTARLLILDGLLTLWTTLALLAAFEAIRGERLRWGWWLIAATACGLGVLTKGPVAIVLLVPPLWLFRRLAGQGVRPGLAGWLAFSGIVLAIALPWYVALAVRIPSFASYFFWEHNVQRFLAPEIHVRGVWFYPPVLVLLLLPGSLLVVPFLRSLLNGDEAAAAQRSQEMGFSPAGGRLVRAVLHSFIVQAAHLCAACPALPGPRPGPGAAGDPLAGCAPARRPGHGQLPGPALRPLPRPALVRLVSLADEPARRGAALVRRPRHDRGLLPTELRLRGLLPGPDRPAQLPEQGNRGPAHPGPHQGENGHPLHASALVGRPEAAPAAGGAHHP